MNRSPSADGDTDEISDDERDTGARYRGFTIPRSSSHHQGTGNPKASSSKQGAMSSSSSTHLATSHEDTTNGAVHCFQDEKGNWFTYTFNDKGVNMASSVMPLSESRTLQKLLQRTAASVTRQQNQDNSSASTSSTTKPSLAKEDASLSSSAMSLCSGLTVILDNQLPPSSFSTAWSEIWKPPLPPPPPPVPHVRPDSPVVLPITSSSEVRKRFGSTPSVSAESSFNPIEERLQRCTTVEERSALNALTAANGVPLNAIEEMHRVREEMRDGLPPERVTTTTSSVGRLGRELPLLSSGHHHLQLLNIGTPGNALHLFTNAFFERRRLGQRRHMGGAVITSDSSLNNTVPLVEMDIDLGLRPKQLKFSNAAPQTLQYYKLNLCFNKSLKIRFDRLSLLALLDRNLSIFENIFNVFLVILVGVLGCLILHHGFYQELNVFIYCVVMASCQYSLFKSVQPDAASPTHGYNHIILYSRPIYFCVCCGVVLITQFYLSPNTELPKFILYGINLTNPIFLRYLRDFMLIFILSFPLLFSFGLLPQVNTFLMYILEQADIHIFGGNATTSLSSSIYCIMRSCLTVLFLFGFAYGALSEDLGTQHILYSIFCALTVVFSYHLSRSAADPSTLWQLIQQHMWPEELKREEGSKQSNSEEDEPTDPLPEKLRNTVQARLTHDILVCTLIAVLLFAVHSSTVFTLLLQGDSPDVLTGLWIFACLLGFNNHYIIPQLRKQQPWLCVSHPLCMAHEYGQFEVYDAAKVMLFEKVYVWLCVIEKNIVYPLIFLCALTKDASTVMQNHNIAGPLIIVLCGMKCLRSAFSQQESQYLILAFTKLFFNWDCKGQSESFLVDYFFMSIIYSKVYEFLLKLKFIVTYIAPWQITWGSAFHAFAQPFSVPHSAMLFIQAAVSAVLSTPLNPILGSAIFVTSYVRPIKFWERDYNTKRMDHSNTRLSSLLEQNPGADDNNLNSIFYEHLTRSLQHSLCGDLTLGKIYSLYFLYLHKKFLFSSLQKNLDI